MAKTKTTTKTATRKSTKTATKAATRKLTGKAREAQSRELFRNIREYNLLGFRIGDGLRNMFDTLVTAISGKKMKVLPDYRYEISPVSHSATFRFRIKSGTRIYTVYTGIDREDPGKSRLVLFGANRTQFPFSERGVRDIVKEIKAIK